MKRKKTMLVLLTLLFCQMAHAQTFGEWFQQKKTQKEYLLKQIAALQVYIGYARKGYKIAKQGLNFIGDMKNGEFNLHKDYFNSLKSINPEVSHYFKVAELIGLQVDILNSCKQTKAQIRKGGMMRDDELEYINGVFERLLDNCSGLIDELITVTTADKLEMKDDERVKRIDQLYEQMQDNYTFVQGFGNEAKLLSTARSQESNDVTTSRTLNGIKN